MSPNQQWTGQQDGSDRFQNPGASKPAYGQQTRPEGNRKPGDPADKRQVSGDPQDEENENEKEGSSCGTGKDGMKGGDPNKKNF